MPRIRTIKPEFWDSPGTARASLRARLFFIAMWNWADDYGIGTANGRQLIGFAFPNDPDVTEADFPRLRTEVAECFGVLFYNVDGRPYYAIPSWDKHQKNERRAQGKNPPPPDDVSAAQEPYLNGDAEMRGTSVQMRGSSGTGTGEQGNRGTGEEETCATALRETPRAAPPRFDEFWSAYPLRRDRRKAEKAFVAALKRAGPDAIIDGAHRYAADPNREERYTKYAEGWLNGDGWTDDPLPSREPPHNGHVYASPADERVAAAQAFKSGNQSLKSQRFLGLSP